MKVNVKHIENERNHVMTYAHGSIAVNWQETVNRHAKL